MKHNVMFLALLIVAFLFPTVGSVSNADAQPGSRLCGISLGPMAILLEIKQPKGKKGRKRAKKCEHKDRYRLGPSNTLICSTTVSACQRFEI